MIKDTINIAIKTKGLIEMEYSKDGVSNKFFQLYNVWYSEDYGDEYLCGFPIDSETELIFRIDKIMDLQLMWNDIYEENIQFDKAGVYAFTILGDNYLDIALYCFEKGEKVKDHCHYDIIDMLAYHYIPFYSETNKNQWLTFDKTEKVKYDALYVFAYTLEEGLSVNWEERNSFLISGSHFKSAEHSGIYYTVLEVRRGFSFDQITINEGLNVLGYSRCCKYSPENLRAHNKMKWEKWNNQCTENI